MMLINVCKRGLMKAGRPGFRAGKFHVEKCVNLRSNSFGTINRQKINLTKQYLQDKKAKKTGFGMKTVMAVLVVSMTYAALDSTVRDNAVHVAKMMRRSGIVTVATVKCLLRYKRVLSAEYATEEDRQAALSQCHAECADITYNALSRNGGIYIKLGQHLSALTYLLPHEWPEAMIPLQDQCPQSSMADIRQLFVDDLGQPIEELFSEFDENPIGVASLAQVHIATLKETRERVAVKCQHPSLKEFVPLDLVLTQTVFKVLGRIFPEYDLTWLGDELQRGIYIELDFNIEAQNSRSSSDYFSHFQRLTALRIPQITWASKRILIMEYIPGVRLDDLDYLDKHHISRAQVSACLAHIFNNMIFTPGVGIHCDPHGGNLAIKAVPRNVLNNGHNFEIILYDHGQYRHVSTAMRRAYSKMWLALLDSNQHDIKKYAQEFAGVSDQQFPLFAAAITGRDFDHALHDVKSERSVAEIQNMSTRFQQGLLTDLMDLLASLPRIVLLILKTNDLVRNLDERLHNPMGQEKGFLIMASYCAKTVFYEDKERLYNQYHFLSFGWLVAYAKAWCKYERRISQLYIYDFVVTLKRLGNTLTYTN